MVPGKQPSRAVTEWCGRQEDLFICTIPAICCFVLFFFFRLWFYGTVCGFGIYHLVYGVLLSCLIN